MIRLCKNTMIPLCVTCHVLLVLAYNMNAASHHSERQRKNRGNNYEGIAGQEEITEVGSLLARDTFRRLKLLRNRRSLVAIGKALLVGLKAKTKLLYGTRQIPSSRYYRQYIKHGDYKQAMEDFDSVSPMNVQSVQLPDIVMKMRGQVGDRTVVIKSAPKNGFPTLTMYKSQTIRKNNKDVIDYSIQYSRHEQQQPNYNEFDL